MAMDQLEQQRRFLDVSQDEHDIMYNQNHQGNVAADVERLHDGRMRVSTLIDGVIDSGRWRIHYFTGAA